jgi:hypothetical protein
MARTSEYPVVISAEFLETKKIFSFFFVTYLTMLSQLLIQRLKQKNIVNDKFGMT